MNTVLTRATGALVKQATAYNIIRCVSSQHQELYAVASSRRNYQLNLNSNSFISPIIAQTQVRTVSSFLNKRGANSLWNSVSSVSAAGRKRGRGKIKGRKIVRDLNKGQVIGIGKDNIQWPGLSAPIIRGREIIQRSQLPKDEKYQERLLQMRERVFKKRRDVISPIDRGWTGGHPEGRKIGPPDPIGDEKFEGFDTVILQQKQVVHMTSHFGRYRSVSAICCTGNGNGLVGFGWAKSPVYKPALRRAKNRAAQRLMYIPRYEDRTVLHNFYSRFINTKVYVWKQSEGYGLNCHRVIKSVCEMIGIKDLYAKVEGSTNTFNVLRAFLLGLLRQKSIDEIANEVNLHVVERSKEHDFFPKVVASPDDPITQLEETPSFDLYLFDNQVFHFRRRMKDPFINSPFHHITLRKREKVRSHYDTRIKLRAEHNGNLESFLTSKHPECKPWLPPWSKVMKEANKNAKKDD